MATQRYISTSFWDDAWIRSLDPSEKFVYLYLMTNPLTNIAGVYEITVDRICFDTGYNADTVDRILIRYRKAGKVYRYKSYIILPSWPKHQQWMKRSKIETGIIAILKTLSPELLGYLKECGYSYPIDTLSIPYLYPSNYSDSEFDSEFEFDSDLYSGKPESEIQQRKFEVVKSKTARIKAEDSTFYNTIKDLFIKEQPGERFSNYAKEGTAIKQLIKKAEALDSENPEIFLQGMMQTYSEMREQEDFYRKQPFTPSALNSSGIWDRVLTEAQNRWQQTQPVSDFVPGEDFF